jgi:acyl carrier protein
MELDSQFDKQVYSIVVSALPDRSKKLKITNETFLQKELGLDSLAILALVFRFEETFHVDLRQVDVDIARLRTVGDLINTARQIVEQSKPV